MSERIFGPKSAGHPSIGEPCPNCRFPFREGDMTRLEVLPPEDPEEIAKMEARRPYTAPAYEVHDKCPIQQYTEDPIE